jgi:hypothetical protein
MPCLHNRSVLGRPWIDDSHDGRVHGRFDGIEGECGLATTHEKDELAGAGTSSIRCDERPSDGSLCGVDRLEQEKRQSRKSGILARRHDVADDARDLHG